MRTQDPKQDNPQDQNQTFTTENQQPPSMENPDNKFQSLKTLHDLLVKETKERQQHVESLVKAKEALEIELGKISAGKVSLDIENGLFYVFIETQMAEMDGLVDGLVRKMKEQENEIGVLKSEVKELTMRVETERNGGARQMGHGNEKWRQKINSGYKNPGGLVCFYCGEVGHSKQRCFEIIGYPDWWDFTKKPRKNFRKPLVHLTEAYLAQPTANVAHPGHSNPEDSWLWC